MDRTEAYSIAQARANQTGRRFEVWKHVGDYGRPGGDIPATGSYRVLGFGREPGAAWAMVAIAEPDRRSFAATSSGIESEQQRHV